MSRAAIPAYLKSLQRASDTTATARVAPIEKRIVPSRMVGTDA